MPASQPQPQPQPPQPTIPLPQAHTLLTSFNAFLTVSIHTILYYRHIYPQHTFLSSRAYNLPVHQNRHPKVCSWIRDAVDAVAAQIASGAVQRVAVVLHAPLKPTSGGNEGGSSGVAGGAVLERWMFDVSHFPAWPGGAEAMRSFDGNKRQEEEEEEEEPVASGAEEANSHGNGGQEAVNWADLDEQLRGVLRRLTHAGEKMTPLPEGCTFTVAVELREEAQTPIGHPQPWIPSQPSLQTTSKIRQDNGKDIGGASTTPIRSVEAGPLFFECWVEESKAQAALKDTRKNQETSQLSS